MDRQHAMYLKATAYRTIRIIEMLEEGKSDADIFKELGKHMKIDRQLVNYYRRRLKTT